MQRIRQNSSQCNPFPYARFELMSHPNLQTFVWRRHVGAYLDGHQQSRWKPTEISVTTYRYGRYQRVYSSHKELKHRINTSSHTLTVQMAKSTKNKSLFLTYTTALLTNM